MRWIHSLIIILILIPVVKSQNFESFLRSYADEIINNSAFEFVDKESGEKFSSTIAIGLGLMLGLFSRWASLGGMLLLGLYYLANPPFIGLGDSSMMEGNYLIVNKNLVELIALWVLFQHNNSKVFGIDRFIRTKHNRTND